ncbi:MAG: hypothetical protein GW817_12890 [Flavobacteriales bacterium]|nr:hypothetical protein [Flavobacteriales bacterium]NCP84783.1 hypothetical protein [Bacteroidota bacterium]
MTKIIENKLIKEFRNRDYFTREELYDFYTHFEPYLNESTFAWRIHDLKNKNRIKSIRRGHYVISNKSTYHPEISDELVKLTKRITDRFENVKHCIWETEWLNEFSQHQASKRIILIEIEKDFVESLYYELKDSSKSEIYLNPDDKTINYYIAESDNPIVIKRLITRSPISKRTEKKVPIYTPLLEKILVDLLAEDKLFYYLQGSELIHIYKNAISNYSINFTKLFSYAKRREKEQDIKKFMMNHLNNIVNESIDD